MADKITTVKELKLLAKFNDNDTRTISIDNPKTGLTAANIKSVETVAKNTQVILGDKTGAAFNSFTEAKTLTKTTKQLDLA